MTKYEFRMTNGKAQSFVIGKFVLRHSSLTLPPMKKYILPGFIGLGVMVVCILPPILHFLTGPLSPVIGGFVAGIKGKADGKGALTIGGIMGTGMALLLATIFFVMASFQLSIPGKAGEMLGGESLPVVPIVIGGFVVVTLMGTLGAFLGGKLAAKAED